MSTSFLILHGLENHRPPDHWQFWLASRLAVRGHHVQYPDLPEPDAPKFDEWARALRSELAALAAHGDDERVVVCHSLACVLWFGVAAALDAGVPIDRLVLVSPPDSACLPDSAATFRLESFDAHAVRHSVRDEILVVCSDADPYNPAGAQATVADHLGLEAMVIPGAAHITPDSGFGVWPSAETWCLDGVTDPFSVSTQAGLRPVP